MAVNRAKNHFLGKEGCKRMNCAQAVIYAFKDKFDIDEDIIEKFKIYGSGRAPEGVCGAYYAAKHILESEAITKVNELEEYFMQQAGALSCRDVRSLKRLSCIKCVERSSEFLADLI